MVGGAVLLRRKGTASHKRLGRTWVALMIGTFIGLGAAGLGTLAPGRALYRFFFAFFA